MGTEDFPELNDEERAELLEYTANRFEGCSEIPEADTGFLELWEKFEGYCEDVGAASVINECVCPKRPVEFRSPDSVSIKVEDSFAGRIPVIRIKDPADFENVVVNVAYKGIRPDNIEKTGASFVFGKTTRFMILSTKPYSNIPAKDLGLEEAFWAEKSMELRFGHECTHYFTKMTYDITKNILHDELMADFTGMYEAFGFYRAEWFLRFMGLEGESGGRLIFYTSNLSPEVRDAVSGMLRKAAYNLERWSETEEFGAMSTGDRIKYMCKEGLAGLAG